MTERITEKWLKPAHKGLVIRHPRTMAKMPDDGQLCDWVGSIGTFWKRRVIDKSCIVAEPPVREVQKTESDSNKKRKHSNEGGN